MPAIITSRTRSRYERPPEGPFALNRDCWQAQGLQFFAPLGEKPGGGYWDLARGRKITQNGTITQAGAGALGGLAASNDGTNNSLSLAFPVLPSAAAVYTLNIWFNPTDLATNINLLVQNSSVGDYIALLFDGANTYGFNDSIVLDVHGSGDGNSSTTVAAAGTWNMATGTSYASNSRAVWLNASGKGTNSTARTVGTLAGTYIGLYPASFSPLKGLAAHACIWNISYTDAMVWGLYDPKTRWDLYYPLQRRTYLFPPTAAAPGTAVGTVFRSPVIRGFERVGRT